MGWLRWRLAQTGAGIWCPHAQALTPKSVWVQERVRQADPSPGCPHTDGRDRPLPGPAKASCGNYPCWCCLNTSFAGYGMDKRSSTTKTGSEKPTRKEISLADLSAMFPDDETARQWLEKNVWQDGRRCPKRGHDVTAPPRIQECHTAATGAAGASASGREPSRPTPMSSTGTG